MAVVVLLLIMVFAASPYLRRLNSRHLSPLLWRRRLGYAAGAQHLVRVEPGPESRPGEELLAPSRTAYRPRFYPGHVAREDLAVLIGRRSTLKVVCLGPAEETYDPYVQALKVTARMAMASRLLAGPAATELAGQPAARYAVRLNSGDLLAEWQLMYDGWLFVAGLRCHPREEAEAYARGVAALGTWRWVPLPTVAPLDG